MTAKKGLGSYPAEDAEGAPQVDRNRSEGKKGKNDKPDLSEADIQDNLDRYRDEMTEDAPASDDPADRN